MTGRVMRCLGLVLVLGLCFAAPVHAAPEFVRQWGAPAAGELITPIDVERDSAGNVYAIDAFSRTVTVFDAANAPVRRFGSAVGPGQLGFPTAIGVNEDSGEIYVADLAEPAAGTAVTIKRFGADGSYIGEFGAAGEAEGQFSPITGIAVEPGSGRVFVTEGNRVQVFGSAGQFEFMWGRDVDPAGGAGAEACFAGCKRAEPGSAEGEFSSTADIAVGGGMVFVSEDANHRIQRFDAATGSFQLMADVAGSGPGQLDQPRGLDFNPALDRLFVVDRGNHRVQQWSGSLAYQAEFGSAGSGDGALDSPEGLAESQGTVVVADPALRRLQTFPDGVFAARFGEPAASTLVAPSALAASGAGVYVTDARQRVLRFDPSGKLVGAWGAPGTGASQFDTPTGIATDPFGNVLVADAGNHRVQRFSPNGAPLPGWGEEGTGKGQFGGLRDLAVGPGGNVFTLELGGVTRVQKFNSKGGFEDTWGAGGSGRSQFAAEGISTDQVGNVYVADTSNDRILKFSSRGRLLAKWGRSGDGNGEFHRPTDVAVDALGNVFVADRGNNRIQRFGPNGRFLSRWGAGDGDGTAGNAPGEFNGPSSIAVDSERDIYVLDLLNGRVQKFEHTGAPPRPVVRPQLAVYGSRLQSPRRLRIIATCGGSPCRLRISGTIVVGATGNGRREPARARRTAVALKPVNVKLNAGATRGLHLEPLQGRPAVRRVIRALDHGRDGVAIVHVVAVNGKGNDRLTRRIRLR